MSFEDEQYQAALDYLYSFIDYSLTKNFKNAADKFDLNRVIQFLETFDNPHNKYPVIHVAGTKGKGSTGAMIASVLMEAGYQVGFYTSPHLKEYTERIKINGKEIPRDRLVEIVELMKPEVAQIKTLTTFELTTALGFIYFAQENIDFGVIEVGLGGRLDATNVVDPLVSVITSLSLDHMQILGDTLDKIAFEKGGIIKPKKPIVTSGQQLIAYQVLGKLAAGRGAPLINANDRYSVESIEHSLERQVFRIHGVDIDPMELQMPLLGAHQLENAVTAFAALQVVKSYGYPIEDEAIISGFERVSWPARFEVLSYNPRIIVDSAHNRDSAKKLHKAINEYLPNIPIVMVFGASDDKDVSGMLEELAPGVESIIMTQSTHPRSRGAAQLAELGRQKHIHCEETATIEDAVDKALSIAGSEAAIVITGSIFVAAGAREYLLKRPNLSLHTNQSFIHPLIRRQDGK